MDVNILPTVFSNPPVAYAMLGYCDGKLGHPANPPKGQGRVEYMGEYVIGKSKSLDFLIEP